MNTVWTIGEAVPIEFHAERDGRRLLPVGAYVSVYCAVGEIVSNDDAEITPNETVRYILDPTLTKWAGDYVAHFTLHFPEGDVRKHSVHFVVLPQETAKEAENVVVLQLGESSSDEEIEYAISHTIRELRRQWKMDTEVAIQKAYEVVQKKIGRRLEK